MLAYGQPTYFETLSVSTRAVSACAQSYLQYDSPKRMSFDISSVVGSIHGGAMQHKSGFTLIEIVMVLVLLGILTAVAVPKYFDLAEDARTRAFQANIAILQANIYSRFSEAIMSGDDCSTAHFKAWGQINSPFPYKIDWDKDNFVKNDEEGYHVYTFIDDRNHRYTGVKIFFPVCSSSSKSQ